MPELLEMLQQAAANDPAPAPAPVSDPEGTAGASGVAPQDPVQPSETDDLPGSIKEYLEKNPDHKSIVDLVNREMKGAWTPRLQEAAELRKMVDGIDPQMLQGVRQLVTLAQTNPAQAAEYLRQQAEILMAGQQTVGQTPAGQPPAVDPAAGDFNPLTDTEARIWQEVQAINAWRQRQEQVAQKAAMQQEAAQVTAELNRLSQELGVEIPLEARAKAWEVARRSGLSVEDAFYAVNRAQVVPVLVQRAKDQASSVVNTKAALAAGNPGGVGRQVEGAPAPARDFKSILNSIRQESGAA